MKTIATKNGQFIIDDKDLSLIDGFNWNISREGYVRAHTPGTGYGITLVHRLITNAQKGMDVDHINGNKLDNRRSNLRICTRSQNNWNARNRKVVSATGYIGVQKARRKFTSRIRVNNNVHRLGTFDTPEEASSAYQNAARLMRGEFHP